MGLRAVLCHYGGIMSHTTQHNTPQSTTTTEASKLSHYMYTVKHGALVVVNASVITVNALWKCQYGEKL